MYRKLSSAFAPILIAMVSFSSSEAGNFHFIEETSKAVLATLQTDGSDPFNHTNITGLSFSQQGDSVFGFGIGTYASEFEDTFNENRWTTSGNSLIAEDPSASGIFFDGSPPPSTVLVDPATPVFSLRVEPSLHGRMVFLDGTLPDFIDVTGTWRAVPEPPTCGLLSLSLPLLFWVCRRRIRIHA